MEMSGSEGAEGMLLETARTRNLARCWLAVAVIALTSWASVSTSMAAEVSVLSASAMTSVITDLAEAFRQETGHSVTLTFATAGEVEKRVSAREATEVVITTDAAMARIAREGFVVRATNTIVGRTGLGIGVREGAQKPDITSVTKFKQTLLAAKSITFPDPARGGASGIHFARVLEQLEISWTIKEKVVLGASPEAVCRAVAKGEVELCVHQISEILPVEGVTLVGPLPWEVQNVTTFSAAVSTQSSDPDAARAFLAFLARPSLKAKFAIAGLDYRLEALLTHREQQAPSEPSVSPTPAVPRAKPATWAVYRNARLGFALRYPADVFTSGRNEVENNDRLLTSKDGRALLRISAMPNRATKTVTQYRRLLMAERYANATFDYTPQRNNWFVLSGSVGEQMFYERITFSCDRRSIHGWLLVYPLAERPFFDPIVEEIDRSYRYDLGPRSRCAGS